MFQSISFLLIVALPTATSFSSRATTTAPQQRHGRTTTILQAAGQGFGKDAPKRPSKTYENPIIRDVIDTEAAMSHFFSSREEWLPLFRWLASDPDCPAESFLGGSLLSELEFHEETTPWRRLEGIPKNDDDRLVLASFLDQTQQALIDIPVNNSQEDDEDDIEFLEEGRRLLALQRFHVLRSTSVMDDNLFETCWNELAHLTQQDEEHTGSLILTPDCDLADLRRFADMNLMRPLEWLGLDGFFEVSSFSRGSPAIRLFYKLNDMPTDNYHDDDAEQEES
mmetsp:Transcript_17902/g.33787  ORF Transcript_17902/g.33787 Transcript_17902/m.33787 type:complete len:281 (-) Transcript_17902:547-1389(-)|eukprot:scaffold2661_cov166-Amphora_coffeaeformis.AAC.5